MGYKRGTSYNPMGLYAGAYGTFLFLGFRPEDSLTALPPVAL